MRTFSSLIPTDKPTTSTTALACVLLDRAGVDAESLLDGLTVIACPQHFEIDVGDVIDELLFDGAAARGLGFVDKRAPALLMQGHIRDAEFRRALARGIPAVLIGQTDSLPADASVQSDRWHSILPDISDHAIGRTIALVTGDDVLHNSVRGLADKITPDHLLATARPGLSAAVVIDRLRDLAKMADDDRKSQSDKLDRDLNELEKLAKGDDDAIPLAAAAVSDVTRLRDLHGYGAAKDFGMQLASDIQAFKDKRLAWEDCDRGILLVGEPGTGKTFYAQALAAECDVPLIQASYGDMEAAASSWQISKAIKKVFSDARKKAPCIVFMDELDSYGVRGANAHNDSFWGALINALLAELDGAEPRVGVFVCAATNHPDRIDPALLRPGRLERTITLQNPDIPSIVGIIGHHMGRVVSDYDKAATACRGMTPASIAMICREARRAARRSGREVTGADVVTAADASRPKRSESLDRGASIHEAAHAVAAISLGIGVEWVDVDMPANKIRMPEGVLTRDDVERVCTLLLAGRRADAMINGAVDSGASDDLAKATALASNSVARWGLTGRVHALSVDDDMKLRDVRDAVTDLLETCDLRAAKLVDAHRDAILRVAEALRARRYLDGAEVAEIVVAREAAP